jgi:hypothetical protein
MLFPVRLLVSPLVAAVLTTVLVSGCSGDDGCAGTAYHADLDQDGATTPIQALETWLGTHDSFDQPPDEGWIVQDSGAADAATVVITNDDGDGWWVSTVRTNAGGYVVDEATDDAQGCGDEIS